MPRNEGREGRGFASMDPEQQREIAAEGGRASHRSGKAHEWDSAEAAEAGHLGGLAAQHHRQAAFHHETAGHHHQQAAKHYESGSPQQARLHADAAYGHGRSAQEHTENARRTGRGFAGMDPERQREIASEGGRASHASGRAHEWDREEASEAGRMGGQRSTGRGGGSGRSADEDEEASGNGGGRMRGGTREQHAEAGRHSHD